MHLSGKKWMMLRVFDVYIGTFMEHPCFFSNLLLISNISSSCPISINFPFRPHITALFSPFSLQKNPQKSTGNWGHPAATVSGLVIVSRASDASHWRPKPKAVIKAPQDQGHSHDGHHGTTRRLSWL